MDDDDFLPNPNPTQNQGDISGVENQGESDSDTPETIVYNPFIYDYNHLDVNETEPPVELPDEPIQGQVNEQNQAEEEEENMEPVQESNVNPFQELADELEEELPLQVSGFLNEIVNTLQNLQPHDDDETTSDDDFEELPSPPVRRRRPLMEIRMGSRRIVRPPPPPMLRRGLTITAPEQPLSSASSYHSFSTPPNRGGGFTPGTNLSHSVENIFSRLFQGAGASRGSDPFSPGPGLLQDVFNRSLRDIGGVKHIAKKEVIDTLPVADISAITEINEEDVECAICLMKVVDTDSSIQETSMLPCRHPFHKQCIAEWLKDNSKCPVCRYELPYDEISLVTNQVIPEHPSIQPLVAQQENHHEAGDDNDDDATELPPEHFVSHQAINLLANTLSSTFGTRTDFPSLFDIFSPTQAQPQPQSHPQSQPQPQPHERHTLQTPLPFFFTQNSSLALPLTTLVSTLSMPPPIPPPGQQSHEETHIASLDDEHEQEQEERIFSRSQSPEQHEQEQEPEIHPPEQGQPETQQPPQPPPAPPQTQRHIFTFTIPFASNQNEDMELQEAIMRSLRET
jgi:hypothetical protein